MKRVVIFGLLSFILLFISACNFPLLMAGEKKMTPEKFETNGLRMAYSGDYYCFNNDPIILSIDSDGVATLTTTGPVFIDYINCTLDPSGFKITYTINGIANPDTQVITFTSCNEGGFSADGAISYKDQNPKGQVSCIHSSGEEKGDIAITITVPAQN